MTVALSASVAYGQFNIIVEDDFTRPPTTTELGTTMNGLSWFEGGGLRGFVSGDELVFPSEGVTDRDWAFVNLTSVSPFYVSTMTDNTAPIVWTFNMQSDAASLSGVGTSQNGMAYVLASNNQNFESGNGYAVVLGNPGSLDRLRLVKYNDGLDNGTNLTNIVKGGDFLNEYLAVKVIYDPVSDNWTLQYASSDVSFPDPGTASYSTIGSSVDNTYTGSSGFLYTGPMYSHSALTSEMRFDNLLIIQEWVLPITLETFEAYVAENDVTLNWVTGTEINNDFFTLEHSMDGSHFEAIGTIAGNGTTTDAHQYSFLHEDLFAGTHYYRLVQNDYNGLQHFSNVITARISAGFAHTSVSPNPVFDVMQVSLVQSAAQEGTIYIMNLQGQVIMQQDVSLKTGQQVITLNTGDLDAGTYLMQLMGNNGESTSLRFVKNK